MQFLIKWEIDMEVGGNKAPITCDVRLGAVFDDQPTACFLGRNEPPTYGIESDSINTECVGLLNDHRGKLRLF